MSKTHFTSKLPVGLFRFTLTPAGRLVVPAANKGNMLRGGFGYVFRRLCCIPQCKDTQNCPITAACPYKAIFEPSPPAESDRLSKNRDIPRPFVFRGPQNYQTDFKHPDPFQFDLVLIGRALEFLPYFVLSFRELATQGLGLNRARSSLERVDQLQWWVNGNGPVWERSAGIFAGRDQLFRAAAETDLRGWMSARLNQLAGSHSRAENSPPSLGRGQGVVLKNSPSDSGEEQELVPQKNSPPSLGGGQGVVSREGVVRQLTVRFLTPTLLRAEGQVIRQPDFHHLFKRLRDRINTLCTFFGAGPLEEDFKGLGERSEHIRTIASRMEWVERSRTSSKTGQRHELSGFVGQATYEGELTEFLPWLFLGELVHVGKHTAWGNGWIELVFL